MSVRRPLLAVLCLAVAWPVWSAVEHRTTDRDPRVRLHRAASDRAVEVRPDASKSGREAVSFEERHGGQWRYRLDPRTDRFTMR